MRAALLFGLALAAMLTSPSARAAGVRLDLGFDVGYLIWGGAMERGGPANPTGGIVFIPSARITVPLIAEWCGAQYALAPMVLAPFSEQTGIVAANDLGVELVVARSTTGAFGIAAAGTAAPLYANFCNVAWCYPEALVAWGGALRVFARTRAAEGERSFAFEAAGRILYAEPTAWNWPGLDPDLRRVNPTSTTLTAGGSWSW